MAKVTFDLESLTWGELGMVEAATATVIEKDGKQVTQRLSLQELLNVASYRQAVATMVLASRNGEPVPSWHDLMNRKVLAGSSSPSPTPVDSPSAKSSDSA